MDRRFNSYQGPSTVLDRFKAFKTLEKANIVTKRKKDPNFISKFFANLQNDLQQAFSWLRPFKNYIYDLKCNYGVTVSSYFTFHKNLCLLNFLIGIFIYLAALIPQVLDSTKIQDWAQHKADKISTINQVINTDNSLSSTEVQHCYDLANQPYYQENSTTASLIIDTLSATGYMIEYPLLYKWFDGRYATTNSYVDSNRILAIYLGCCGLAFLFSLMSILRSLKSSIEITFNSEKSVDKPIFKYAFCGYDFHH